MLKMALEDQKKLTSIHNALVVMLSICRDDKICHVLKRGEKAGHLNEETLQQEPLKEELQNLSTQKKRKVVRHFAKQFSLSWALQFDQPELQKWRMEYREKPLMSD